MRKLGEFFMLESLKNVVKDDSIGVPLSCLDNRARQRGNSKPETVHFPLVSPFNPKK